MGDNTPATWAVAEAKARLSEVLRLARQVGPQKIGAQQPCYVLSEADYRALTAQERSLGAWLVAEFSDIGELPLPDRAEADRQAPFSEDRES